MKPLPSWAKADQWILLPAPSEDRAKIQAVDHETGVTMIRVDGREGEERAVRSKFLRRCFPVTASGEPDLPAAKTS